MSKGRVVTLDNAAVIGLLKNASLLNAFPALKNMSKQLKAKTRGCGRCNRSKHKAMDSVVMNVKRTIGSWPVSSKNVLKKALNADKVRLVINKKMTEF